VRVTGASSRRWTVGVALLGLVGVVTARAGYECSVWGNQSYSFLIAVPIAERGSVSDLVRIEIIDTADEQAGSSAHFVKIGSPGMKKSLLTLREEPVASPFAALLLLSFNPPQR
jgi:hypothetical protein